MKKIDDTNEALWLNSKQMEGLRDKLRARLSHEDPECSSQLNAFDRIVSIIQMDPALFRVMWLQPLLDAGATYEVAFDCIAQSYIRPN